jgi:hypothetical protein
MGASHPNNCPRASPHNTFLVRYEAGSAAVSDDSRAVAEVTEAHPPSELAWMNYTMRLGDAMWH